MRALSCTALPRRSDANTRARLGVLPNATAWTVSWLSSLRVDARSSQRLRLSAAILLAAMAFWPSLAHAQYFIAYLNGDGVHPPTDSPGTGLVEGIVFGWRECETEAEFDLWGYATNLTGTPQAVVLARGLAGEGSEVIHALSWRPLGDGLELLENILVLDREQCLDLWAGNLHVLVSTDSFPSGEIAGQMWESPDPAVLDVTWGALRATYR